MTTDGDVILPIFEKALSAFDKKIEFEICRKLMVLGALRLAGMPDVDFEGVRAHWN